MRIAAIIISLTATGAVAQESGVALAFEGGLGVQSAPSYFGSSDNEIGPTGSFGFDRLRLGPLSFGGGEESYGFGFTGSFRYIADRTAEDYAELAGLDDIDAALEVGGGLTYTFPDADLYLVARRGFGGHEGYVAEFGGDYIIPVSDQLTLRAGPRLTAGDDSFTDTYFGVTGAEAAASAFDAYDPDGGVLSRGLEISADYAFGDNWGVTGTVRYDEWLNDAANSPIVEQGSSDSVTASIVITRDISFGF